MPEIEKTEYLRKKLIFMLKLIVQDFINTVGSFELGFIDKVYLILIGLFLLMYFNLKYTIWIDKKLKNQKNKPEKSD